ncbi:MAG: dCTP deaminase, partial [Candidatus Marinamargulisbacteria bacterium]
MILSDITLNEMIEKETLTVSPLAKDAIQPGSIDCRLGSHYLVIDDNTNGIISMKKSLKYREINGDSIIIAPHSFILATTMEYVKLPKYLSAFVEGRSSIGRMGL